MSPYYKDAAGCWRHKPERKPGALPRGRFKQWWKRKIAGGLARPLNAIEAEDLARHAYDQARRELLK